jgi:ribA/ribD-fused uncharacterized protein
MHIREFIEKNYPEYYSIERYPADKTAAFCKVDAPWGIFSNFGRTPLVVDGVSFDCSEKLFQVMKFADTASRKAIYGAKGQTMKMKAKHQEKVGIVRPDWGEIIVDAMKFCLMQKYSQSEAFRTDLERSRGLFIVEDQTTFPKKNPDTWGVKQSGDGKEYIGPNLMGRLLMELRDNGKLDYVLPSDATVFQDLYI